MRPPEDFIAEMGLAQQIGKLNAPALAFGEGCASMKRNIIECARGSIG